MLGLAGLPLGLAFRFLDPSPDACAREVGELVVGEYGDAGRARPAWPRARHVVTYEFENVPVEAAARVGAVPGVAALEHGPGPAAARRSSSARSGSRRRGSARSPRPGLPALVKTRRLGYDGKGQRRDREPGAARRGRARRGARRVRPRALDRRRARARRRDAVLAGGRERPSRRDPPRHPGPRPRRAAARGRGDLRRRCWTRSDYVGVLAVELFEVGGRLLANEFAPRVHNTAHWTIDGAAHEPVREPPARDPRAPARRDRRASAGA